MEKNINLMTQNGNIIIDCNQILYVEGNLQSSRITFISENQIEVILNIDDIEKLLEDKGFLRFNYKYVVNLRFVQVVFPSDASKVILENGKEIFVNHNKKDELFKSLREVYELHEIIK